MDTETTVETVAVKRPRRPRRDFAFTRRCYDAVGGDSWGYRAPEAALRAILGRRQVRHVLEQEAVRVIVAARDDWDARRLGALMKQAEA